MKFLKGEMKAQRQAGHKIGKKGREGVGRVEDVGHRAETELCGGKLETLKCQVGKCEPDLDHGVEH